MRPGPPGPRSAEILSRPLLVARLPAGGQDVDVVATAEECVALARELGLPEIRSLFARYRLASRSDGVHLTGRLLAEIVQVCVVSLDEFESRLEEDIEVRFVEARTAREGEPRTEIEVDGDEPDEIVDGRIDLGAVTSEFLALGLDPYPRKPGVAFEPQEGEETMSPFARLAALKPRDG